MLRRTGLSGQQTTGDGNKLLFEHRKFGQIRLLELPCLLPTRQRAVGLQHAGPQCTERMLAVTRKMRCQALFGVVAQQRITPLSFGADTENQMGHHVGKLCHVPRKASQELTEHGHGILRSPDRGGRDTVTTILIQILEGIDRNVRR